MNLKQKEIYEGLKSIGEEIASFYADGVKLINSDFNTKSYLIAHAAREIDGGLRDILSKDIEKNKIQKKLSNQDLENLKDKKGHVASILTALNADLNSDFAKKWISVATEFVNFTHRHGPYKNTRSPERIIDLWNEYEEILLFLVGNFLNLLDRIDRIIEYDEPTIEIIETLSNLLKHQARYVYFFNKLESSKWLKPLFEKGYFSGKNNPEPIPVEDNSGYFSIPYWGVLEYLKKISKENYKNPKKRITGLLAKIIDDIISYRKSKDIRIENYHTDYSVLQIIGFLPSKYIVDKYFYFLKIALLSHFDDSLIASGIGEIFLRRFIEEKNKELLLKTLDIILSYEKVNDFDIIPLLSEFWLKETIRIYKDDLLDLYSNDIYYLVIKIIKEISEKYKFSFNNATLPTIGNNSQTMFPDKYECQIVYLVRDALMNIKEENIQDIILSLLKGNGICVRLALYTINQRYDTLSELFWEWEKSLLKEDKKYRYELFELFKNHAQEFTKKQLMIIIDWIDEKTYWLSEEEKENTVLKNKIIAYKKKEWLFSLLESKNKIIIEKYDFYDSINPEIVKHPGLVFSYSSFIGETSPLSKEEILSKSLSDNIDFFISFSQEKHDFLGPSLEGLADTVMEVIKDYPNKFLENCKIILEAPIYFQYTWIRGLKEGWKLGKTFDIEEVFNVSYTIIQKAEFWINNNSKQRDYENLFISELAQFIEEGVKNNSYSFDSKNLNLIKKILLTIFHSDKKEIFDHNELSLTAINNSKGITYSALLRYSLKYARENKDKEDKWDNEIKNEIEKKLFNKKTDELLFFTLGQFYRNLLFINYEWTISNFNNIFSKINQENFEAAISGYFFYNHKVYKEVFQVFYKNKIYEKALVSKLIKERSEIKRNIVHHICLAFSNNVIDLNDKLIEIILNEDNLDLFNYLHFFFWNEKNNTAEIKRQIPHLWKKIFNKFKINNNENVKIVFLGQTALWVDNVDEITDEIYDWLTNSINYISDRYYFIKGLNKHIDKSTDKVANLLVKLFEHKVEYDISRGMVQDMIKILYEKKYKMQADKICLLHANEGNFTLRKIYKKYK